MTGVKSWERVSAVRVVMWRSFCIRKEMMGGKEKDAKMVILSRVANIPIDFNGIGLGSPTPNMRANALSFKTLNVTFAAELPTNLG